MIYVLFGENSYAIKTKLKELEVKLKATLKNLNTDTLTMSDLAVNLQGTSLFASAGDEIIVIKGLSDRKDIYSSAIDFIIKNKDSANIVLIENSLDKRTALYKQLSKNAQVKEFKQLTSKDRPLLIKWLTNYVQSKNPTKSPDAFAIQMLIDWVGPNQESLANFADRLLLMDNFTKEGIEMYVPKLPTNFAFDVLKIALKKDLKKLNELLQDLKQTQDPYMLMGLLISQIIQIRALSSAGEADNVAKDTGSNPYALNNLKSMANLSPAKSKEIIKIFYEADKSIKSTGIDPWQAIEIALTRLARA